MQILVTGGAGYIGSHTSLALLQHGHRVAVLDDLSNSSARAVRAVTALAGKECELHVADIRDSAALDRVFAAFRPEAVIHCAGLKAVAESVEHPLRYYDYNVIGSVRLLEAMARHACKRLVFSSSATVYGDTDAMPIRENATLHPNNPYGRTKLVVERLLADAASADTGLSVMALRYFNPVGAHPSGDLGEDPLGQVNNLMPLVMQVAVGRRPVLRIFGHDYPTPDGTAIRDYVHVVDLALAHTVAIERVTPGFRAINLGTGRGHSVKEVVAACEAVVGHALPVENAPRRAGDAVRTWADATLAEGLLGWRATRTLADMCGDAWRWQQKHPSGYEK